MTLRILVVGAGIAGLAAARALRLAGFRPDVVEELPATMSPSAGIYLPGNASRALRLLGLDAPLRPLGDLIFRQVFLDARGRELFELDVAGALGRGRRVPRAVPRRPAAGAAHRGRRRGALRHRGPRPGDLRRRRQGRVRRRQRRGVRPGRSAPTAGARRSGPRPGWAARPRRPARSSTAAWSAAGRRSATGPRCSGGGRRSWRCRWAAAGSTATPTRPPTRRAQPGRPAGPPARTVRRASAARCRPSSPRSRRCRSPAPTRWCSTAGRAGPVLLVGDAAHATAPTLAQGAAMAFEDAVVLGEVLQARRRRRPGRSAGL